MVSGQLEDSLRHELESYIEGRIGGIKQEIAALQSQLNESLSRMLDRQGRSATGRLRFGFGAGAPESGP